jgi:hypothetical protein
MRMLRKYRQRWPIAMGAALLGLVLSMPGAATAGAAESRAERGYQNLLTKAYNAPFMAEAMLWDLWKIWPEPLRTQAEKASSTDRRQMILAHYGLVDEPGRELPVSLLKAPTGDLTANCLACHAGKVAGRYIRGLGNSNYTGDALGSDIAELMSRENLAPPSGAAAWPAGFPLPTEPDAVGANNAFANSDILLTMRDKDLNLQSVPQYPLPTTVMIPIKTPPWWTMKRKKFFYWDGFAEGSVREGLMQFTNAPSNSAAQIKSFLPDFEDVYAWIVSLPPPKYPWPVDKALAARGLAVFTNNCAQCHGTYGRGGTYPEKTIELREVGTDPLRIDGFSREFRKHLGESWFGEYGKVKTIIEPKGYVAPPLDGVWATAPYLHNGSVPTLMDLLNPDQRPKIWRRTADGYDTKKVGIEAESLTELPRASGPGVRRDYYQTSMPGLANSGHRYPAKPLSEKDQNALLEYLKTL